MPFKQPRYNAALTRDNNARDRLLEPSGGVYIPEEPDYLQFRNIPASEIEERLLQQRALALTQSAPDVQEPVRDSNVPLPPSLAARVEKEGEVRMTPEEESVAYKSPAERLAYAFQNIDKPLPYGNLPETTQDVPQAVPEVPSATTPSRIRTLPYNPSETPPGSLQTLPGIPRKPLVPAVIPEPTVSPAAPTSAPAVAPPVSAAPVAPQEDRLTQLARIVSMSQGQAQQTDEDRRRMAIMEALGKASAAMNAGLTRTPVPASVFAPPSALMQPQTQTDRLEQLYKASRILGVTGTGAGGRQEKLAGPLLKERLKRLRPEVWSELEKSGDVDALTESDVKSYLGMEQRSEEQAARTKTEQEKQKRLAEQFKTKLDTDATKFIGMSSKQLNTLVNVFAPLKTALDDKNTLKSVFNPGAQLRKNILGGVLTSDDEKAFNSFTEAIVGPVRKTLYGAQLTSQELQRYDMMMAQGAFRGNPKLQLLALRDVVKGVQNVFANTWAAARNSEPGSPINNQFLAYEQQTGFTENNPLFDEFYDEVNRLVEEMPDTVTLKESLKSIPKTTTQLIQGKPIAPKAPQQKPSVQGPAAGPTPAPQTQVPASPGPDFKRAKLKDGRSGWYNPKTKEFIGD